MRKILKLKTQWCQDFFYRLEKVSVAVIFLSVVFFATALQGNAATGSSWSRDTYEEPAHRSSTRARDVVSSGEISPFSPGSNNIAIDVGQVFLTGDLTKFSDSLGTQLHYTYGVSDLFGFDTSFGYSEHSDARYSLIHLLTGLRINLSWFDKVVPFGVFGLGFYRPNYKDNTAPNAQSINAVLFGVHLGLGVDLALSKNVFFGAGLTFHNMFGVSKTWANGTPLNIGGNFLSFLLHIGASF